MARLSYFRNLNHICAFNKVEVLTYHKGALTIDMSEQAIN